MRKLPKAFLAAIAVAGLLSAVPAMAHEVYVLDREEIAKALVAPKLDYAETLQTHLGQFLAWGATGIVAIVLIFAISVARPVERALSAPLRKLKRYAPSVAQATLGAAMLASGVYGAAFGVELPFGEAFGPAYEPYARVLFLVLGAAILLGIYPRIAAGLSLLVALALVGRYGSYMLNYATYYGEMIAVAAFGGAYGLRRLSARNAPVVAHVFMGKLQKYKFLLLRLTFGASLVYASLYAKFSHGALALETVEKFGLTRFFPFDPLFLVMGAMLVEIGLGVFFAIGLEIRAASLFFLVFLTLSVWFFGEAVWPHIILFGTAVGMFLHGYDPLTLGAKLNRDADLEPVL